MRFRPLALILLILLSQPYLALGGVSEEGSISSPKQVIADALLLNDSYLLVGYRDGTIQCYEGSKLVWTRKISGLGTLCRLVPAPQGLAALFTRGVATLDLAGKILGKASIYREDRECAFCTVGANGTLVFVGVGKQAVIYTFEGCKKLWSTVFAHSAFYGRVSDDGRLAFVAGIDTHCPACIRRKERWVRIVDLKTDKRLFDGTYSWVYALEVDFKRKLIALVTSSGLRVYNYSRSFTFASSALMGTFSADLFTARAYGFSTPSAHYFYWSGGVIGGKLLLWLVDWRGLTFLNMSIAAYRDEHVVDVKVHDSGLIAVELERFNGTTRVLVVDAASGNQLSESRTIKGRLKFSDNGERLLVISEHEVRVFKIERPPPPSHLELKVTVLSRGRPLKGASVRVKGLNVGAITDSRGVAVLNLTPGTYEIEVTAKYYKPKAVEVSLEVPGGVVVELERAKYVLEVVVVDEKGEPLLANVTVLSPNGTVVASGTTIDGSFKSTLLGGTYNVSVIWHDEERTASVDLAQNYTLRIEIKAHRRLIVNINSPKGKVENVKLTIADASTGAVVYSASGGPSFVVSLYPGTYDIVVEAPGYALLKRTITIIEDTSLNVTLVPLSWTANYTVKFYIYGSPACPHCSMAKKLLSKLYGSDAVEFRDIAVEEYAQEHEWIYEELKAGENNYIPLILVMINGKLKAAVVGAVPSVLAENEAAAWRIFIKAARKIKGVLVCREDGLVIKIEDEDAIRRVEDVVLGRAEPPEEEVELSTLLPMILTLAAADSINPCTFSVFTALLLLTMALSGRKKVLAIGLAFTLGVYATYFALGLGLIKVFAYVPLIKYVIVALGLFFGSMSILSGWGGEFRSPVPRKFKSLAETAIEKASKAVNPLTATGTGVLVSLTLLPCSSGPYLVATAALAALKSRMLALAMLALYNAIFVAPLIAIMIGVATLAIKARELKVWRTKKLATMETISGILLILISLYALFAI